MSHERDTPDQLRAPASTGTGWILPDVTRDRLWPTGLLFAALALVATLTNDPGDYVGDNRFEQFWGPAARLLRESGLWDASRGIGRVGEEFWPVSYPIAVLRGLGLSAPLTEHVWHAGVLVIAGLGMVSLLRVFLGRVGPAALLAGLLYMFNPFTATFLLPSVLFWNYAIAPWLLVMFLRGVGSTRPWRWAAGFALLVFSAGNADTPGTFFAVLWLVPAAIWLVVVDRRATWRQVAGWLARAAALTVLTTAAALAKTLLGSDPLAQRLQFTELPERVNETSSWAESWRGLGFWLSYFSDASGAERLPGGTYYYETALGVLVTFVAPVTAAVVLWKSRWRARSLFGALALVSLVLMVGSYPPSDPPPTGWLLLRAYDAVPGLASLRNTYKAGSGLMMAVAALVGVGVAIAAPRLERTRPGWRALPGAVAVVVVLAVSLPFWNGGLYPERNHLSDVPTYWQDALSYLDARPGSGRVLVLPGTTKTAYRWGEPGDDIFDTYLHRHPNVISNAFPLSGPQSANLVDALEARIADGTLGPGELGPIARALGVDRVLIRNDLDWEQSQVVRPGDLDLVRHDPDLELDRRFGDAGQSVVDPADRSYAGTTERSLPPVEIYTVRDAAPTTAPPGLARPDVPPLLVSGDGGAWPVAAAAGVLDGQRPVAYTGDLDAASLLQALDDGSPLVVTDTNRRRLTRIRGAVPTQSHTLSEGQDLDQPAQDLFGRPGTQSVAEFQDATAIEASSSGTRITGFQPWLRPANAFDGNYTTSWLTGGLEDPTGAFLRVQFAQPETIDRLSLLPFLPSDAGRRVTDVSLHFSSGEPVPVHLEEGGTTEVRIPARQTTFLELRIDDVSRAGTAAVGFREIAIPGVDLTEVIAIPDDVATAAASDGRLRAALADAPLRYLFDRVQGTGAQDEEVVVRRSFRVAAPRTFDLSGRLGLDVRTTDLELDRFLSGFRDDGVSAHGSTRAQGALENRGLAAIDGDPATAWAVPPRDGEELTILFPTQTVSRIQVTSPADAESSPVNRVDVLVGGREESLDLETAEGCDDTDCEQTGTLEIPPTEADKVVVRLASTVAGGANGNRPARLSEVAVSDGDGPPVRADGDVDGTACNDTVLTVDGRPRGIRLAPGDLDRALDGEQVPFTGCDGITVPAGRHVLATADAIVDAVGLASGSIAPAAAVDEPSVEVLARDAGHLRLRVESAGDTLVSTGQSFDPGWRATADGADLGPARPVGTLATWSLPAGEHVVDLTYAPERTYRGALVATLVGVVLCVAILLRPALRARAPRPTTSPRRPA